MRTVLLGLTLQWTAKAEVPPPIDNPCLPISVDPRLTDNTCDEVVRDEFTIDDIAPTAQSSPIKVGTDGNMCVPDDVDLTGIWWSNFQWDGFEGHLVSFAESIHDSSTFPVTVTSPTSKAGHWAWEGGSTGRRQMWDSADHGSSVDTQELVFSDANTFVTTWFPSRNDSVVTFRKGGSDSWNGTVALTDGAVSPVDSDVRLLRIFRADGSATEHWPTFKQHMVDSEITSMFKFTSDNDCMRGCAPHYWLTCSYCKWWCTTPEDPCRSDVTKVIEVEPTVDQLVLENPDGPIYLYLVDQTEKSDHSTEALQMEVSYSTEMEMDQTSEASELLVKFERKAPVFVGSSHSSSVLSKLTLAAVCAAQSESRWGSAAGALIAGGLALGARGAEAAEVCDRTNSAYVNIPFDSTRFFVKDESSSTPSRIVLERLWITTTTTTTLSSTTSSSSTSSSTTSSSSSSTTSSSTSASSTTSTTSSATSTTATVTSVTTTTSSATSTTATVTSITTTSTTETSSTVTETTLTTTSTTVTVTTITKTSWTRTTTSTTQLPAECLFDMAFGSWKDRTRSDITCLDFDGDGDLDCIVANQRGYDASFDWARIDPIYYENTGTPQKPFWEAVGNTCSNWRVWDPHDSFQFKKCMSGPGSPFHGLDLPEPAGDYYVRSECADFDGDGDYDCVWGLTSGKFLYLKNVGSRTNLVFEVAADEHNPFEKFRVSVENAYSSGISKKRRRGWAIADPVCRDFDSDGDIDCLIFNANDGDSLYAENIGSATNPEFVEADTNPFFRGLPIGKYAQVEAGDINGDGLTDFLIRNWEKSPDNGDPDLNVDYGTFNWWCRNGGTATQPRWNGCQAYHFSEQMNGYDPKFPPHRRSHPFWDWSKTDECKHFALGDYDGDGDLDYLQLDMCDTRNIRTGDDPMTMYWNMGNSYFPSFSRVPNNCTNWGAHTL